MVYLQERIILIPFWVPECFLCVHDDDLMDRTRLFHQPVYQFTEFISRMICGNDHIYRFFHSIILRL